MQAIDKLSETPRALGMHPNTEIGWRSNTGSTMMSTLLDVFPLEDI